MTTREQMDELVRRNGRLATITNDLQVVLRRVESVIGRVIDAAEPVAWPYEEWPAEYSVPAQDINELRAVLEVAREWASS